VGALLEPVEITITREDPTTLPPLPDYSHLPEYPKISSFYRVKPSVDIEVNDPQIDFKVSIPVNKTYADGTPIELGMLVVTRGSIYRKDIPFLWVGSSGIYNAATKQVDYELRSIEREGIVFFVLDYPYPIPGNNVLSQSLQLQQTTSNVQIQCPRPSDCTPTFINNAQTSYNAKKAVYETAIGRKLALTRIRIVSQNTCAQEFVNGDIAGGTYFYRGSEIVMCLNKANGVIFFGSERGNPPITFSHAIKHEMFHAAQGAFYNTTTAADIPYQSLFHEGTAEMAVNSTDVRTEVSSRVTRNLVTRFADIGSPTEPDFFSYTLQDFWAYLGRDNGRGLSYLKGFLEFFAKNLNSDVVANLDGLLAKSPSELSQFTTPLKKYNSGLSQVYWSWIKNLGYESQNQYKLRNEVPCEINRLATTDVATMPSINYVFGSGKIPLSWRLNPLQAAYTEIKPTGSIKTKLRISIEQTFFDQGMKAKIFRSKLSSPNRASVGCVQIPDLTPTGTVFENIDDDTVFFLIIANPNISTVSRPVVIIEPVAAVPSTNPSNITLSGTVGSSTNTEILTISNTGDLDSTLEYKQYFTSTNLLDSSLLNTPVGAAGSRLTTQAVSVPPRADAGLIAAAGFTPSASSEGSLTVVTAGSPVSSEIPVSYYCSRAGTFSGYVNVVYSTGAVDEAGVAILESTAVGVTATCEEQGVPKVGSVEIKPNGQIVKLGQYAIMNIVVTNIGNAPLSVTVDGYTTSVEPNGQKSISYNIFCDVVSVKRKTIVVTTNDPTSPSTTLNASATCIFKEKLKDIHIATLRFVSLQFPIDKYCVTINDQVFRWNDITNTIGLRYLQLPIYSYDALSTLHTQTQGEYKTSTTVFNFDLYLNIKSDFYLKTKSYLDKYYPADADCFFSDEMITTFANDQEEAEQKRVADQFDFYKSTLQEWQDSLDKNIVKNVVLKTYEPGEYISGFGRCPVSQSGDISYKCVFADLDVEVYPTN
jgi:hypothetical protein